MPSEPWNTATLRWCDEGCDFKGGEEEAEEVFVRSGVRSILRTPFPFPFPFPDVTAAPPLADVFLMVGMVAGLGKPLDLDVVTGGFLPSATALTPALLA